MSCTASTIKAFGLRSNASDLIVVWVFDDDTANTAQRDYAWTNGNHVLHMKNSAADARKDAVLTLLNVPAGNYVATHYNTWDVAASTDDPPQPAANGSLNITLGTFPVSTDAARHNIVWDGADALLIIKRQS
jgi:hypothetical protein